ncbi:MurR/RpiR family transcriptional regulator [Phaeobacter sp. J2-8]|uniref:MurR/RpiR family transcriptional regulator n=1 Tax=Phaeobacter sp. J2-8 TaxID=2931394 RepID=UPI001FD154E2|nr:MurR/RpiR family transcriptional regulator [Phaeobacter sp. J2-8]MCJ7874049.1 MurR/RpiR family transcriptional regulator [Phaeobacter sp. J2-8]
MSIAEKIQGKTGEMTRSELQLAETILNDYPISGLGSITEIAEKAGVSTPTVLRMVRKLGFGGYTDFQSSLRAELGEVISNPIAKHTAWKSDLPDQHIISRYSRAASDNHRATMEHLDLAQFDALCQLIADRERRVFIAGGRITGALAQYMYLHLQMIRPDVRLLPGNSAWAHDLLDIRTDDLLIVFDVRRYQNDSLLMAQMAADRGAVLALFTDQWRSPIHRLARLTFGARIAVPSAWDTNLALMLLVECTIAAVQEMLWDSVKERTDALETAFDQTKLFRKFT